MQNTQHFFFTTKKHRIWKQLHQGNTFHNNNMGHNIPSRSHGLWPHRWPQHLPPRYHRRCRCPQNRQTEGSVLYLSKGYLSCHCQKYWIPAKDKNLINFHVLQIIDIFSPNVSIKSHFKAVHQAISRSLTCLHVTIAPCKQ